MKKMLRILAGLLLGGLVGAGLALLFAPGSGDELQQRIQERLQEVRSEGQRAAEETRLELSARLEELKRA